MGIFSRVRDIISSNINAMLDRAEDPEKLVRLMIQEMEDTLVEVKASCAGAMANKKKVERELRGTERRAREWDQRARLAVDKGREDLAREALVEKRRWQARRDALYNEAPECDTVIEQYQDDIRQLEDKLNTAREKQRMLIQRHIRASKKRRAQQDIRRLDTTDAWMRFEQFENRIERMEAEGELVNYGRKPNLDDAFAHLEFDEEIEKELAELRRAARHENDQNESVTPYEG
jgi:phage shock protein A